MKMVIVAGPLVAPLAAICHTWPLPDNPGPKWIWTVDSNGEVLPVTPAFPCPGQTSSEDRTGDRCREEMMWDQHWQALEVASPVWWKMQGRPARS